MNELKDLLNELRSELKTFIGLNVSFHISMEEWIISVLKPYSFEFDFYEYDSLEATIEGVKNLLEINKILQK